MKRYLFVLLLCSCTTLAFSQSGGGYYISRSVTYPDAFVRTDPFELPISLNREDVKAIGMGKSQVGNGKHFNAMMYNPALLSYERVSIDAPVVQASLPTRSFNAINFLRNHYSEFKTGTFLKQIKEGIRNFKSAATFDEQLAALRLIQEGLRFPAEVQENVGGSIDDPRVHGINVVPSLQAQFGNWGFSLYGIAQTGFLLQSSEAVSTLSKVRLPERAADITPEMLIELAVAVDPLFTAEGELRQDALPEAFAVSYVDLVGAAGYALPLSHDLSIGASLKVLNRRLSSKRVAADQFDNILKEVRKDFDKSITGVTVDLGALYRLPASGTEIGVSVQNAIPVRTLESDMKANLLVSGIVDYDRDQFGNPIITNGDTALVAGEQKVSVAVPFELRLPVLANLGVTQPLTPEWDISFDWVDIAEQDGKFESYIERFRVGTEYRLDIARDKFGIAFRGGMADKRPTAGFGVNLFRVVQLDGAYAYDNFTGENSYFAQVKINW